jgi:hypothetical protein
MPISTTAPIDAKTQVWSAIAIVPYPGKNMRRFLIGCRLLRVNNYKRIIDMHIILVHVVHSIQSSCIKYSTQNQYFAEIFTYSDNTNYNLNFYYILLFQFICDFIYSAIIQMCMMSVMTPMAFSRAEYSADHSALIRRNRRNLRYRSSGWVLRALETTARGVYSFTYAWCPTAGNIAPGARSSASVRLISQSVGRDALLVQQFYQVLIRTSNCSIWKKNI